MRARLAGLAAVFLVLSGCAVGPDYERPELATPDRYLQTLEEGASFANVPWWELFADPQLEALIRTALEQNEDLGIAAARVEEFRAIVGVTRADQFPTVDAVASGARVESSDRVFPGSLVDGPIDNFRLGAEVFFEVDLFGRLRRSTEAARAQLLAVEESRRSVTISLIASVASTYMLLRDLDAQLEIARRTAEARADSLTIIRARHEKGTVPLLDVNQAEIELAVAIAAVAAAERLVVQTENALAVLVGGNPGRIVRGLPLAQQVVPPAVPAGLPSELLQRRPDVLAAEAALAAQTARIGVAE
ncbi:MAG TPA: efflux transporter outer membrane subunit, partial [Steroidobacteraceae bacterium]|nr:efflux transporter outer membrane subunit [Steroidobacteraceae bacterium]